MAGRGSAPGERRGGRKKGVPNKLTADLKSMIIGALDKAGGLDYLLEQSAKNPTAFLTLVGKVLPLTVDNRLSGNVGYRAIPTEQRDPVEVATGSADAGDQARSYH